MANFPNTAVAAQESLATTKVWHIVIGLYIWEFFTTLEYEWKVIRGRLPYRRTIWIYSLARVSALLSVMLRFVMMDPTSPINCQVWGIVVIVSSFLSISAASLLIVLRVVVIWNRNRIVVATALTVWTLDVAFLIQGVVRFRSAWLPAQSECGRPNADTSTLSLIAWLVTDIALLLVMLAGLFRRRVRGAGMFGMTQLLWRQGVIWLMIATAAEVPPVLFLILNVDDQLKTMFQVPSGIIIIIAATRMHRSLVDFAYEPYNIERQSPAISNLPVLNTKRTAVLTALDQVEVVVHVVSERHPTLQGGDDVSQISGTDEQIYDIPNVF